jgi:AcrR family transcriptional regulator
MGIKERQERDREAVRRAILDAARDLFTTEGYRHVSIRKIAERIEYSPAAIYSYFPSKDDIFFSLAEEGFRLLGDPANCTQTPSLGLLERIRAIFWRLYQFSREHPQYFELMFVDRSVPRISREYERFAFVRETKQHLIEEIERGIEAGVFPPTVNASVAVRLLTVGLLGVAVLSLSERLSPGEDPDCLASDVIDTALAGLQTGIPLKSSGAALGCAAPQPVSTERAS